MNRNSEYRRSILMHQAERLLRDEGLLHLHVDLKKLAETRDIVIKPMRGQEIGVSGMLVRHGDKFGILYDESVSNEGYQRFSIAHELGHFFVDGHVDHIPFDGEYHRSRAGFVSDDPYEREADYFAAGLLMPTTLVRPVICREPDGLSAIESIQKRTRASLTASAIRYADLAEIATAIVVSRAGKVDYCFMSDAFKSLKGIQWPRKGTPVPSRTPTASLIKKPDSQRRAARDVDETDIMEWFDGGQTVRAQEEVVDLGSYDRVLTVLTCPGLLDDGFMDEDDDSDEALEESWTPRFRR